MITHSASGAVVPEDEPAAAEAFAKMAMQCQFVCMAIDEFGKACADAALLFNRYGELAKELERLGKTPKDSK